ncbi:tRNA uridine-5-carboxymethylaminomethyl(34) synthesis GTPase MnmE [bacterium]|nr:tRNA uridine-5-carboxymethylaminomethyl(34) synthesis GTPase MnmE [bacterium]
MFKNRLSKTVAAIATPIGEGGISVIRISGDESLQILKKIFFLKSGKNIDIEKIKPRYCYFGLIKRDNVILDENLAIYFKAPNSFTGEDVVELHLHGGLVSTETILKYVIEMGAILAEKGEFTERAFLYGKLDLVQAESVLELIKARNAPAHLNAAMQLRGKLSDRLIEIKEELFKIVTVTEASIDFPDEDYDFLEGYRIPQQLTDIKNSLTKLSNSYYDGKIFSKGATVAIAGAPNAGKSSLMNRLLKTDRALVTEIAGTTRDYIEADLYLKGIPVTIIDTAGIRVSDELIEKAGIELSIKKATEADFTLFLVDERGLFGETEEIYKQLSDNKKAIIQNKMDKMGDRFEYSEILISAKFEQNIDELRDLLFKKLTNQSFQSGDLFIANERHKYHIDSALKSIIEALNVIDLKLPIEFIARELRDSINEIGAILGETTTEDILGNIFSSFCIGK